SGSVVRDEPIRAFFARSDLDTFGIRIPDTVLLHHYLQERGVNSRVVPLTVEEVVEGLARDTPTPTLPLRGSEIGAETPHPPLPGKGGGESDDPLSGRETAAPLIEISHLSLSYPNGARALDDVSPTCGGGCGGRAQGPPDPDPPPEGERDRRRAPPPSPPWQGGRRIGRPPEREGDSGASDRDLPPLVQLSERRPGPGRRQPELPGRGVRGHHRRERRRQDHPGQAPDRAAAAPAWDRRGGGEGRVPAQCGPGLPVGRVPLPGPRLSDLQRVGLRRGRLRAARPQSAQRPGRGGDHGGAR